MPVEFKDYYGTFKVRIPAGVQEGQTIRVPGKGGEGSGGASAGDLYLRVRLAAHPDFRPRGADLYHDLHLAPWEAVLGCTVEVPALDGKVNVRIPPGTNNGQQLRVRGSGLPRGQTGERGEPVCGRECGAAAQHHRRGTRAVGETSPHFTFQPAPTDMNREPRCPVPSRNKFMPAPMPLFPRRIHGRYV